MTEEKNRIEGFSHTKAGNKGFTELVRGYKYPKSDSLCFTYNGFQKPALQLQIFINTYKSLLDLEDIAILNLFINTILFDTGGITWTRFEELESKTDKIKNIFTKQIEERTIFINSQFKNAKEFIAFTATEACELGLIWIEFRNIEHFEWAAIHRFFSYDYNSLPTNAKTMGSFYNLVGDYFYNLCRYIQKKVNIPENYWKHE